MPTTSSSGGLCPDPQTWCGYADGSIHGAERLALATHVQGCDSCFATLTQLRRDLAEDVPDVRTGDSGPPAPANQLVRFPGAGNAIYAVAAALALLWVGIERWVGPDAPVAVYQDSSADTTRPGQQSGMHSGILGFAADGTSAPPVALRAPTHVLVVFTQFAGTPALPVPTWGTGLFNGESGQTVQGLCSAICEQLSMTGTVLPKRLQTRFPASAFSEAPADNRRRYAGQILQQLRQETDLAPLHGDGDGLPDFVVLVLADAAEERLGYSSSQDLDQRALEEAQMLRNSGYAAHGAIIAEHEEATARDICRRLQKAMKP